MKKQIIKIRIIYFLKFFADALFSGYLSMYFLTFFDLYSLEYGILLGAIPFCSLVGNFLWGLLSKDLRKNLLLIKIILITEIVSLLLFVFVGKDFITLLIFTVFVSLCNSPYFSFQDGIGSAYAQKDKVSYTSIRIMGSCGYLLALALGAGAIYIFKENYQIIFFIAGIIYLICLAIWFFVEPFDNLTIEEKDKIKFREVLKNKYFLLYFLAYIFIIGSNNVADSYLFARMSIVNVNSSIYSLVFASEVLFEIIISLLIIKFVKEKDYFKFLKISVLFIFLRAFLFGFNLPLPALIIFAPLRGIGWGGFISLHLMVIKKIVSKKLVTKTISLLAIALSLVNGIFTLCGTSIYSQITLPGFYFLLSGVIFIGIIILYSIKNEALKQE